MLGMLVSFTREGKAVVTESWCIARNVRNASHSKALIRVLVSKVLDKSKS